MTGCSNERLIPREQFVVTAADAGVSEAMETKSDVTIENATSINNGLGCEVVGEGIRGDPVWLVVACDMDIDTKANHLMTNN